MERDSTYDAASDQHFWDGLRDILKQHCETYEAIDDALRSWLGYAIESKGEHIQSEYDIARCAYTLISSPLFESHSDYVRRQIIFGLLQDDEPDTLHFVASFLRFDGQEHESTFEMMNHEGAFPRLVHLISSAAIQEDAGLHRLLMDLLYDMGRIQMVHADDLMTVDDDFIIRLFQIIEELSDDVNDPYHYPVIRLLLVLNEQFMVAAHEPHLDGRPGVSLTNKVIKVLSSHGSKYKTFGENIILLLNRESETSLQLLTLKLLYLLFTTPSTHEYFYTNDLRVLVDILIRNLLDLPEEASALRHTYLRVLYPLLAHTQLRYPPHYKRDEIRKLLAVLMRGQLAEETEENHELLMRYFEDVDDTTKRLVTRCGTVPWLRSEDAELSASPLEERPSLSPTETRKPPPPTPRKLRKRNSSKSSVGSTEPSMPSSIPSYMGMDLEGASVSTLSVHEVAAQREKPGVMTPSRKARPPLPPKARRSGWLNRRDNGQGFNTKSLPEEQEQSPGVGSDPVVAKESEIVATNEGPPQPQSPTKSTTSKKPKPPPMPKARRWRVKNSKERDEEHKASIPASESNGESIPAPPPVPVLGSETQEKSSFSAALSEAQAEAVNSVTEALEKTDVGSSSAETPVLAHPPAPPVAIMTPLVEGRGEKSPFEGGSDEED